jgi:Trp operon repressor
MPEPLDSRLRDDVVLDEIELTSRLIIAASSANGHLSQREVDEILGVAPVG